MCNFRDLLFVVINLIVLASAKPEGKNGKETQISVKIIDGIEVVPHSRPYMVAIRTNINYKDVLCGGSLISDSLVLTAATCVFGATEADIILGAHDIEKQEEDGQQTITATEFIIHEGFNKTTLVNDIALILLPKAAPLGATIATIKLPEVTDILNSYEEQEATVAGWGKINDTTLATSNVLRYQNLTVIPLVSCEIAFSLELKGSQMCTSGVSVKNICLGDNGGPLVLNGVQIGIASYGNFYGCSLGFPGVYTRLTSYLGWLLLAMS